MRHFFYLSTDGELSNETIQAIWEAIAKVYPRYNNFGRKVNCPDGISVVVNVQEMI